MLQFFEYCRCLILIILTFQGVVMRRFPIVWLYGRQKLLRTVQNGWPAVWKYLRFVSLSDVGFCECFKQENEKGIINYFHIEIVLFYRERLGIQHHLIQFMISFKNERMRQKYSLSLKLCGQLHFRSVFHETFPSCLGSMYMYILQLYCVTNTIYYFSLQKYLAFLDKGKYTYHIHSCWFDGLPTQM